MTLYRFNVPGGGSFGVRLAVSTLDAKAMIGAKLMPIVSIADRTAIDTVDPMTIAALDSLAAPGGMGPLSTVTITKGVSGTTTVNYDAAALQKRTEIDTATKAGDGITAGEVAKP